MSIQVVWDNDEKTIIRYTYQGQWTWDELAAVLEEAYALLDTVDHPVDFIIDLRQSVLLPKDALRHGERVAQAVHPNEGRSVVVGANMLVSRLADVFYKIYRRTSKQFRFVATLDEAYALLSNDTANSDSDTPS